MVWFSRHCLKTGPTGLLNCDDNVQNLNAPTVLFYSHEMSGTWMVSDFECPVFRSPLYTIWSVWLNLLPLLSNRNNYYLIVIPLFFPSPLAPPSGSLENHADTHPASSSTTTLRATVLRSPLLCQPSFDFDSKHYTQSPPLPVPISKPMIEPKRVPPPPAPQDLIAKGTVVPAVMLTRSDSDIPVHPQSQVLYISGKPPPPPMRST